VITDVKMGGFGVKMGLFLIKVGGNFYRKRIFI